MRTTATASRRRAREIDRRIRELAAPETDAAVLAVGGYGRERLAPKSDIDLLVLVRPRTSPEDFLRSLLYPLWDSGATVGHSVRTPKGAVEVAGRDPCLLTALLAARLVSGSRDLFVELTDRRDGWIARNTKGIARAILKSAHSRRATAAPAAWSLAPDIKDAAGGLRDFDTMEWLQAINPESEIPLNALQAAELLLAVREMLHRVAGRKEDILHIDLQPMVAERLGYEGERVDDLMRAVHFAARHIEHETSLALELTAKRILGGPRRSGTTSYIAPGVALSDGELVFVSPDGVDVVTAIRLAACASHTGRRIATSQYATLEHALREVAEWDAAARDEWLHLLAGRHVVPVLQLLDNLGAVAALFPEWKGVRGRAQYDPYHRYTVDAHSFHTVAEVTHARDEYGIAQHAATEAGELSPLYLAALLHDVGKGSGEDHSVAGERIALSVGGRMGLDHVVSEGVAFLVRHHLLLTDIATRRDLDDGAVIEGVAKTVADVRQLKLLYLLSIADARATGPQAWSRWKASLLAELYRKVQVALETGDLPARSDRSKRAREVEALEPALTGRVETLLSGLPPSYLSSATASEMADELLLLDATGEGAVRVRIDSSSDPALVTLVAPDRPGTLARAAGVLSLHRMAVLKAQAYSASNGLALERFVVRAPNTESWVGLDEDLEAVFAGRLALDARLRRKVLDYKPRDGLNVDVRILDDASDHSTVVEVRTTDALGVLYCIATALAELDVDIRVAKIDTLGNRVVDVFYVRNPSGSKLDDEQSGEIEQAIRDRIANTIGAPIAPARNEH